MSEQIEKNRNEYYDALHFITICCQNTLNEQDFKTLNTMIPALIVPYVLNLANQHGTLPLVYTTLKKYDLIIQETIDCSIHEKFLNLLKDLQTVYRQNAQRNIHMSSELLRIFKLFQRNGIEIIIYKGPALAQSAYGDITLRQFGDLDILIKPEDKRRALQLLIDHGYTPEIEIQEGIKEYFYNAVNVLGFYNKNSGNYVEIHWKLLSKNYAIGWNEKLLWEHKKTIQLNHTDLYTLSHEDCLLYLSSHGSKHLYERLEWVTDIDKYLTHNKMLDWKLLLSKAQQQGILRILLLSLSLTRELLGTELPDIVEQKLQKDPTASKIASRIIDMNFLYTETKKKHYSSFMLLYEMRERHIDKLRFVWYALFATKFNDFQFIQLPKGFTFLYPFIRPVRLLAKYV